MLWMFLGYLSTLHVVHFSVNPLHSTLCLLTTRVSFMGYLTYGNVDIHLVCASPGKALYFSLHICVWCALAPVLCRRHVVIYTSHVSLCLQATEIWGNNYRAAGRASTKIHVSNVLLQVVWNSKNITPHLLSNKSYCMFWRLISMDSILLLYLLRRPFQQHCFSRAFLYWTQVPYICGRKNRNCLSTFLHSW